MDSFAAESVGMVLLAQKLVDSSNHFRYWGIPVTGVPAEVNTAIFNYFYSLFAGTPTVRVDCWCEEDFGKEDSCVVER